MKDLVYAAKLIKNGNLVIFPTETVYGIGADATNYSACQKIYLFKERPLINPLIVHVNSIEHANTIGILNSEAKIIVEKLWPGPLTIVVPYANNYPIASNVTAGLNTIALRYPIHDVAQNLIKFAGVPIAAPSANVSGYISSTTSVQAKEFAQNKIYVIDNGDTTYGIESTILDFSGRELKILRYGFIAPSLIESILNKKVCFESSLHPKAPGMLSKHYSPKLKLRLNAEFLLSDELGLNFGDSNLQGEYSLNLSKNANLAEAAYNLYRMLYLLDIYGKKNNDYTGIAVATISNKGIGLAINDRLNRAAYK